jgi:8-oxo-dGTP pyrophosphatase MutT (NUDIX family)
MRSAAVLVPIFRDGDGELRIVLVEQGGRGLHGGQLALPGGKREPHDGSLRDTALRETYEEIGLAASEIEILTELDPLDTRTTGFRVQPFLARIRPVVWRAAPGEISAILTPPLARFSDSDARCEREFSFASWGPEPRNVQCVALESGQLVWGMTLRLLDALVPRILAGEWPQL